MKSTIRKEKSRTKDRFIGFWVEPDVAERIEAAAREEGRTISNFVRHHIARYLEECGDQ